MSVPTVTGDSGVDQAIQSMKAAFNEAIKTNAVITKEKTKLQNKQNVASQRPQ